MKSMLADVWAGIRTGPARAGLAFFSLALGWFAVAVLLSTLEALQRQARDLVEGFGAGSFVLVRAGGDKNGSVWNRRHVEMFRENLGDAARVSGIKTMPVPEGMDMEEPVVAADGGLADARGWRMAEGRILDGLDVQQGARNFMASADVCRKHGWHPGDGVSLGGILFRLVGNWETGGASVPLVPENALIIPYTADVFEPGGEREVRRVDALVFRAAEGVAPEALKRRVGALLDQPGMGGRRGVDWVTPETLLQGIRRWQRAIAWTAGTGGGLGLLLGAVTLAGMLLTGIRERIPEIGLRIALGARRREIAGLFVAESLVLTLAAALAGLVAAEGALRWLGGRFPLPFHFGAEARLIPLALACVLALLCSLGPAWMAARLPPAEALRND